MSRGRGQFRLKPLLVVSLVLVAASGSFFFKGRVPRPPLQVIVDGFDLTGVSGRVGLRDFKGRIVILYLGYTGCPDVCPLSLARLASVLKDLPEQRRAEIVPLFVSLDYRSDTPAKADQYAKFFIKDAIGLTGSRTDLERVAGLLHTYFKMTPNKDTALGYTLEHGTSFYLINRQGAVVTMVPGDIAHDAFKAAILSLL